MIKKFIKKSISGLTALALIGLSTPGVINAGQKDLIKNPQLEQRLSELPQQKLFYSKDFNYNEPNFNDKSQESIDLRENKKDNQKISLKNKNSPSYLKDALKVIAGVGTQFGVHELGHSLGGELSGAKMNITQKGHGEFEKDYSDSRENIALASGFILPRIISQTALSIPKIPKDNSYVIGLISGPIIHDIAYIIKDSMGKKGNYNDFEQMSKRGLKREVTYPAIIGISALQTYILMKDSKFRDKLNLWVNPSEKGDLMIGLDYKF